MEKFKSLTLYFYKHRIIRYLFSGGIAAATNIVLLFVLVHFFHIWYIPAVVFSFITAVFVSFVMQKFFTFKDYGKERIKRQSVIYLCVQILNLGINTLLMYVSVDVLHAHYLIAQTLIAGGMAVSNFLIYKHLVFAPAVVYNENNR